jgi:hypothetical protein
MLPPKTLDEGLRLYANDTEWRHYLAWCECDTLNEAAVLAGTSRGRIRQSIMAIGDVAWEQGYRWRPTPAPDLAVKGVSTYENSKGESATWTLERDAGMDPSLAFVMPDPKVVDKVATYTNGQGRVIGQWTTEKRTEAQRVELFEQFVEQLNNRIEYVKPLAPKQAFHYKDQLAVYPIGDLHCGMLAWALETLAENWDLPITASLIRQATTYLMDTSPPCDTCFIPFMGDFFHYDGYRPETPEHHNLLDAEGRMPKMIKVGWEIIEGMIDAALLRHNNVHVVFEKGNHDPSTAQVTSQFLKRLYRDNPRVHIDDGPAWYHKFVFGKNLIGVTHGNNCKIAELPSVMAATWPKEWGDTTHRVWFTGHVHHKSVQEFRGCSVETLSVLPPSDAFAARSGYKSERAMIALVLHKEFGEIDRRTVRPEMFVVPG